ncbi:uncharacterized protein ACA1_144680 [Acanthamoeba castellanii str. Neff]|uniref:Uncharacterized protein n=1 Tax=Acanthamoeba castellanii (strain ATCC 30010 / Neff) TaxID=1257118 RepID=L8GCS1_ACACF|nr:uncharacterized protein ACA1_144680 [Acanthamoeba castellanii str. Neff]ELR10877.1 hypothetical protein ACA1_144680 [Acanthamoeba castellanii str. Neff]
MPTDRRTASHLATIIWEFREGPSRIAQQAAASISSDPDDTFHSDINERNRQVKTFLPPQLARNELHLVALIESPLSCSFCSCRVSCVLCVVRVVFFFYLLQAAFFSLHQLRHKRF